MKLNFQTRQLCEQLKKSWVGMHPVDKCVNLLHLKNGTQLSERKLAFCFDLSKSEIHRMISVAKLSQQMRDTCKELGTDYHTLCLFAEAPSSEKKEELRERIVNGSIRRHKMAKDFLGAALRTGRKRAEVVVTESGIIRCKTCGKSENLIQDKTGIDVMAYAQKITTWSKSHKTCKRI